MMKWIPSLLIVCLIEGDRATFVLERAREENEHKQGLRGKCSQAHGSPTGSPYLSSWKTMEQMAPANSCSPGRAVQGSRGALPK